jgi:cytosine/adenosine deaminase-related metal-dependent hydrolase
VHGIALGPAEFDKMKRAGASLIWSPRSNMQLYGETTDVLAALRAGVPIALSPDWSPTGSDGMLDELAFAAAHARARLGGRPTPRELFEMSTVVPARMARLDDRLGTIETGRRADVFLLSSTTADPYEALASARTADISLVLVDGVPAYGDDERLGPFNLPGVEALAVCGRAKGLNSALLAEPFAGLSARLAQKLAAQKAALAGLAECR